jgi:CBS domain containing-hemolysin-like protein
MSAGSIVLWLIVMLIILLLNAFFVATEFALVASRASRIKEMADNGSTSASIVQQLQRNMSRSVSGTQLGITLCSLGLGWVADQSITHLVGHLLGLIPGLEGIAVPSGVGLVLSFFLLSSMHVVLGEQVPKFLSISVPEKVALAVAPIFRVYCAVSFPFIWMMDRMAGGILRLAGMRKPSHDSHSSAPSATEYEYLFDESQEAGQLGERETDLLKRVLDLRDLSMDGVLNPMSNVDAVSIDMDLPALLKVVSKTKHSRLPVYKDSPDHIVGVLYCRDLFDWWSATLTNCQRATRDFKAKTYMRPAFVVQRTHKASALLDEMRKKTVQIAIVKEGTKAIGIVTMEDLLEELVGEINDEHDKVSKQA